MQPTLDVFVVGDASHLPSELTDSRWPFAMRVVPTGVSTLVEFPGTSWAKELLEGEGERAALVFDGNREALQSIGMLATLIEISPELAAKVMVGRVDQAGSANSLTTIGINILLAPRAEHGPIIFRRSKLTQIGPLNSVAEPIWDWVIRAVRAGEKIDSWPMDAALKSTACRLPLLAPPRPGTDADWLLAHLKAFSPKDFGMKPASKVDETALRAGLFQWHDFLDESHQLSQSIEGEGEDQLGDYWHAVMHRREPDYSNAKYWFRQIGRQQIFRPLQKEADATLAKFSDPEAGRWRDRLQPASNWDPFAFVDMCEACAADETTDLAYAARRIQYIEMSLLMGMTSRQCGGDEAVSVALAARHA
jgi:hypothetical protein